MTDVRIINHVSLDGIWMDWLLKPTGVLDESEELATAVIVAIGTDRLASVTDVLPDPDSTDRRGWWGDLDTETIWDGWRIGSRFWLMLRAKITDADAREGATIARIEAYAHEALQPFLTNRIASRFSAVATRIERERIDLDVVIYRGPEPNIDLRFQFLWDEIRAF